LRAPSQAPVKAAANFAVNETATVGLKNAAAAANGNIIPKSINP
jgi:hypothetical protein